MNKIHVLMLSLFSTVLASHLGLFSMADAAVVAFLFGLFMPSTAVYQLILIGTIQDSPGLSGIFWYIGFVAVGLQVLFYWRFTKVYGKPIIPALPKRLLILLVSLVGFGIIMSFFGDTYMGLPQSPDRPYWIVGPLMIFMSVTGVVVSSFLYRNAESHPKLFLTILVIVIHGLGIAVVQAYIDPAFYASNSSLQFFEQSNQLTRVTDLGFSRVTGTYITPNGFALNISLLMIIALSLYQWRILKPSFVFLFLCVVNAVSTFALSKAMIFFALICSAYVMWGAGNRNGLMKALTFVFASLGLVLFGDTLTNSNVLESFRFTGFDLDEESYRSIARNSVTLNFTWVNWLLGTGLSHWPEFFSGTVGFTLADPHMQIMSYMGTFGLFGIIYFLYVCAIIYTTSRRRQGVQKTVLYCLLCLLLIKDFVSVQYLIGNTPITFYIWILLGYGLTKFPEYTPVARGKRS